jgi:hypothetical protein
MGNFQCVSFRNVPTCYLSSREDNRILRLQPREKIHIMEDEIRNLNKTFKYKKRKHIYKYYDNHSKYKKRMNKY